MRDRISGKQVVAKPDSEATVYLVLRHVDAKYAIHQFSFPVLFLYHFLFRKSFLSLTCFWILNIYRGRQSVSARQVAVQIEDKDGPTFVIEWSVNPNAVKVSQRIKIS